MHPTPSTGPADEPDQLARLLVRAERAVMTRRARDVAGHWIAAARLADGLALFALLLPWTFAPDAVVPGYRVSVRLTSIVIVAIVLRQLVRTMVLASADRKSRTAVALIEIGSIAGIGSVLANSPDVTRTIIKQDGVHVGPLACTAGLLAGTMLAIRAAARIHDAVTDVDLLEGLYRPSPDDIRDRLERGLDAAGSPRHRRPPVVYAVGALLIAAAGLLGPWQALDSSAARALNGSGAVVWLGYQLPETLPLRWVLAVSAVAVVLCAAARPLRSAVRPVLAAGGLAILVTATWAFRELSVGGSLGDSTVTLLAAACCLLPVMRSPRRRAPAPELDSR